MLGLYGLWIVSFLLKLVGGAADASWHFKYLRDTWAPPHLINLSGALIGAVLILLMWRRRSRYDTGAMTCILAGLFVYLAAAPLDDAYHRVFGLDLTTWSPTHFMLYTGTGLAIWGVLLAFRRGTPASASQAMRVLMLLAFCFFLFEDLLFPLGQQEYGAPGLAAIFAGHPIAAPELLAFVKDPVHTAFGGIPAWVYPIYLFAAATFGLQVTRRVTGRRWAGTVMAVAYLAYRTLAALVFHAIHFPVPFIPYFISALAVVLDLLENRQPLRALAAAVFGTGLAYIWALWEQRSGVVMPEVPALALPFAMLSAYIGLQLANWASAEVIVMPTQAGVRATWAAVRERLTRFGA